MMKKIWFLYPDTTPRDSNAFGWFRESFLRFGMEVEFLFWDDSGEIIGDTPSILPDVVVMRGYNFPLSAKFESEGVKVVNGTRPMELCRDKIATAEVLATKGIPAPRTVVYREGYPEWGVLQCEFSRKPVVMKLSYGSKGEEVFLLESEGDYCEAISRCKQSAPLLPGSRPLFQEFISTSRGRDLRVWVIGDEVVGHTLRSNQNSFKSNFAQGGNALAVELPEAAAELAVRGAKALELDFAGVDILFGGGEFPEFLVCEVNGNAGFRTASLLGEFDIPTALASFIANNF